MAKELTELEKHYNKFNEEKRLGRRHGQVEYRITMEYIRRYLKEMEQPKILDVGVKYNLGILKSKGSSVKAYQGNALKLSRFADETFDMTLLLGPMYHLYTFEDKVKALGEAKRVTKKNGLIFVAYLMNDYGVLMYGFKENMAKKCLEDGRLTEDFHCVSKEKDLYEYVTLSDIEKINKVVSLQREKIIAPDGAANYMRPVLKEMDEETFELFVRYQMSVAERMDLMGASAHTVDILRVS